MAAYRRLYDLSVGHFPLGHISPEISPGRQFPSPPRTLPPAVIAKS